MDDSASKLNAKIQDDELWKRLERELISMINSDSKRCYSREDILKIREQVIVSEISKISNNIVVLGLGRQNELKSLKCNKRVSTGTQTNDEVGVSTGTQTNDEVKKRDCPLNHHTIGTQSNGMLTEAYLLDQLLKDQEIFKAVNKRYPNAMYKLFVTRMVRP